MCQASGAWALEPAPWFGVPEIDDIGTPGTPGSAASFLPTTPLEKRRQKESLKKDLPCWQQEKQVTRTEHKMTRANDSGLQQEESATDGEYKKKSREESVDQLPA